MLKKLLFPWITSAVMSLVLALHNTYEHAIDTHNEMVNRSTDCKAISFAQRYPQSCAQMVLSPPPSFVNYWVSCAMEEVSLCGPIACHEVVSLRGLLILATLVAITTFFRG